MKSKWKVVLTLILIFTLVLTSSIGSLAFAKDRIQVRDMDCIDEPNRQYCDLTYCDCDQDRLRKWLNDCDFDCIKDSLRKCLMDWDSEDNHNRLRMRNCIMQYLLLDLE
jgi:hypothetical protein